MPKGKDPTIDRAAAAKTVARQQAIAANRNAVKLAKELGKLGSKTEKN